jgi:hypothetical protein
MTMSTKGLKMSKATIVVLSEMNDHGDTARVVTALKTVKDFRRAGDEVELIFDGGGVTAAVMLADPTNRLHHLYSEVEDRVSGVCRYCANAFHVSEQAEKEKLPMLAEFDQHPSLRKRVQDGYEVITF